MLYVGLDSHWNQSTFCVLDDRGRKVLTRTVRGQWPKVLAELETLKGPWAVCFEASTGYGFLFERLSDLAKRVVVAHPGQLRLIFRSKRKTDRIDAEKLAKLLFLDEVPPVYVPSLSVRSWRSMIEHRHRLIEERTRIKNNIRSLLRGHGLCAPHSLWYSQGLKWLEEVEFPTDLDRLQCDILLERLRLVSELIARVERTLDSLATKNPAVRLLETIPGVGPRTAEAVVAYIDNPWRFRRIKSIGRYFGLVPSQDASARRNHLGHITREGSATVRHLLTEAAWQSIRLSPQLRTFYERIRRDDRDRSKIALVATAHYLLRTMLTMLRSGEPWRYSET